MSKVILGYWNIRALAEPIRYILEYTGQPYEERLYTIRGEAPNWKFDEWLDEKFKLGLTFPNLPYLIDGDKKLTESVAVLKYIARKHGLMPTSDDHASQCDMLEGVLVELKNGFYRQFFTPEDQFESTKKAFREKLPALFEKITKFIGDNKWSTGDELVYIDFYLYTNLKQISCLVPTCLDDFLRLQKYVEEFEDLPKIKEYLSSGRFRKYPITGPMARWGFKEEKN